MPILLALVMIGSIAAARAGCESSEHAGAQADRADAPGDARDLDCTIEVDRDALRAGWVEVRFALRPGTARPGCEALALGGITLELWYEGALLHTVVTTPVSRIAPPYFAHGFALGSKHRLRRGRFEIRAHRDGWRSNAVGFALPRP